MFSGVGHPRPEEGHQGQERRAVRDADQKGQGRKTAHRCDQRC